MLWGNLTGVAMMSQGCRRCNGIGSSWTLDLRHFGVSEVGLDQRLQQREAYMVVGLLRDLRPRGRWRRDSGVAASAHRIDKSVTLREVNGLGASGVTILGRGVLCEVAWHCLALLD
ncbi:hypothetical protein NDU88_004948 [Pleurodeles waltl]|uniref:Uncharacterized protein n=1 Tax=Pleurodeles waltl TaxID=8319 RepID=A0AAV7RKM2_PLEWA|nr:hypothetical protein NDU88_004948 [Pleurodeles waltl]